MKDVVRFLQEVQLELGKIQWPSINELIGSVVVVLILVTFFAIYIGGIDVVLYTLAGRIF